MEENNTAGNNSITSTQEPVAMHNDNNTLMGILSYIGPLVIIPLLTSQNDPFVKFHIKQGLVLFGISIVLWLLHSMFWFPTFYMLMNLVNLAIFVLAIIGIVNVVKHAEKELPLVGSFAKYFTF